MTSPRISLRSEILACLRFLTYKIILHVVLVIPTRESRTKNMDHARNSNVSRDTSSFAASLNNTSRPDPTVQWPTIPPNRKQQKTRSTSSISSKSTFFGSNLNKKLQNVISELLLFFANLPSNQLCFYLAELFHNLLPILKALEIICVDYGKMGWQNFCTDLRNQQTHILPMLQ